METVLRTINNTKYIFIPDLKLFIIHSKACLKRGIMTSKGLDKANQCSTVNIPINLLKYCFTELCNILVTDSENFRFVLNLDLLDENNIELATLLFEKTKKIEDFYAN